MLNVKYSTVHVDGQNDMPFFNIESNLMRSFLLKTKATSNSFFPKDAFKKRI